MNSIKCGRFAELSQFKLDNATRSSGASMLKHDQNSNHADAEFILKSRSTGSLGSGKNVSTIILDCVCLEGLQNATFIA
jgi:hypothetical protein